MTENLEKYLLNKIEGAEETKKLFLLNKDKTKRKTRHMFFKLKKYFLEFLEDSENERLILLYGLRGIGKTTLFFNLYEEIRKKFDKEQVLYLSCDQLKSFTGSSLAEAFRVFIEQIHNESMSGFEKKLFFLIDEVHFDKEWELALKSLL